MKNNSSSPVLASPRLFQQSSSPPFRSTNTRTSETLELLSQQTTEKIYGGIASPKSPPPQKSHSPTQPASVPASPQKPAAEWSTALQNLLDQPPARFPQALTIGGLAFCSLFGIWAWFGQVQEVSQAYGKLVPQGEVYKVQPVTQGKIAQIFTQEGQYVKKGDIIAELDSQLAEADVNRLQQSLSAYRLQLLQTQGLIEQTRLVLGTQQAIAAAEAREQEVTIVQSKTNAQTAQNVLGQMRIEAEAYEARLKRLEPLLQEGAIAKDRIFEVEQHMREQNRAVIQQQGQLEQALAEADRLQAGLSQRQAEGQHRELEAKQRIKQLEIESSTLRGKITETETLLKTALTQLEQLHLYAPVSGVISSLKVKNQGEVTQPAQTVAEIIPAHAPLVLSTVLPNREAGLVQVGMQVQIKFDAFPYQEYGVVPGEVLSISPNAEIDDQMGAVYQVKILLDRKAVVHEGKQIELKAGQTAQAEIVTRQRRIIDIILDPIQQLREGGISL